MTGSVIQAVVFDLDGVIRHFDPEFVADVERRHSLAMGTLLETAFAEPGLTDVVTGRLTRDAWVAGVGESLGAPAVAREIGHAKPDVRVFHHVLDALGLPEECVFFPDDSPRKLAGAVEVGMPTPAFVGLDDLRQELTCLGALR